VPHGEEEAHTDGAPAAHQHDPGGVVDGRDVVGVEGVAHPQHVGERAGSGQSAGGSRVAAVGKVQGDTADMQHRDEAQDPGQSRTF
jgi:hypothetical protein